MTLPKIGSPSELAALRAILMRNGYTEEAIAGRFGLKTLSAFRTLRSGRNEHRDITDGLDALVRLFLDGEYVALDSLAATAGEDVFPCLAALDLACADSSRPERCYATVLLYPVSGLWIISDREGNPEHTPFTPPPDVVYPALIENTQRFLDGLPDDACDDFLDLCAGTGIAALIAARGIARHAWSLDITGRATHFASFNAALNEVTNFTALEGDLFRPVEGRTFDRIVAHPPYVPSVETEYVYRDAGEDGEQITRRMIQDLPQYLRPGGCFYAVALGTDREGALYDERIREWLGQRSEEFDVLLAANTIEDPITFSAQWLRKLGDPVGKFTEWRAMFQRLGVTRIFHGFIVIQRHSTPRAPFTVRRMMATTEPRPALAWLLSLETAIASGFHSELLDSPVSFSPHLKLTVDHRVDGGQLVPVDCTFHVGFPFASQCQAEPWMAAMVALTDGKRTVREIFGALGERGLLPSAATIEEFGRLTATLTAAGMLETPKFNLPRAAE